jgi:carbonic anhydrase
LVGHLLKEMLENNGQFVIAHKHVYHKIRDKQTPETTLLLCSDSRVPPYVVKKDLVNKIFCIEDIGNQIRTAEGSVDYGILHLHTPLLLILGHTNCGAIKASLSDYSKETEAIRKELDTITKGRAESKNKMREDEPDLINKLVEINVDYQVRLALQKYKSLVDAGKLTVVGMVMDFNDSYSEEKGAVFIVNINGENDAEKLRKSAFLEGIDAGKVVKRIS